MERQKEMGKANTIIRVTTEGSTDFVEIHQTWMWFEFHSQQQINGGKTQLETAGIMTVLRSNCRDFPGG